MQYFYGNWNVTLFLKVHHTSTFVLCNDFFGNDPQPNVAKTLTAQASNWTCHIANEGETVDMVQTTQVTARLQEIPELVGCGRIQKANDEPCDFLVLLHAHGSPTQEQQVVCLLHKPDLKGYVETKEWATGAFYQRIEQGLLKVFFAPQLQVNKGSDWMRQLFAHIPHRTVSAVSECDVVVCPDLTTNSAQQNQELFDFAVSFYCHAGQKPLVVFVHDDPDEPMVLLSNTTQPVIVFRSGFFKSKRLAHEFAMPSFQCEELKCTEALPSVSIKSMSPNIGFCGCVETDISRLHACQQLEQNAMVRTDFVKRPAFFLHMPKELHNLMRVEFQSIMQANPYQLCCRGCGNWSHRFFETLAVGRIPVLIDTDIALPDSITREEWSKCIVMSPSAEQLPADLIRFHVEHDLQETLALCHALWKRSLSFEGFARFVESTILPAN